MDAAETVELRRLHHFCECAWTLLRTYEPEFASIDAGLIPWAEYEALLDEGQLGAVRRGLREGVRDMVKMLDLLLDGSSQLSVDVLDAYLSDRGVITLSAARAGDFAESAERRRARERPQ